MKGCQFLQTVTVTPFVAASPPRNAAAAGWLTCSRQPRDW